MLSLQEYQRMSLLLRIMNYIYLNPESKETAENKLIEKFGKKNWKLFQQFAEGGATPYAHSLGGFFKLTQEGVREYHNLSQRRNSMIIQILMVLVALFSGIATIITFFN